MGFICEKKKKIQSVLVDCQRGIGETLKVKPLTWGAKFWVARNLGRDSNRCVLHGINSHDKTDYLIT